jgi:cytosine deaminase
MSTLLTRARTVAGDTVDLLIEAGRIRAVEPAGGALAGAAAAERVDAGGRLVAPGFVETHIHLDKSCLLERCRSAEGTLAEAIAEVARAKRDFTEADVYARAARTLEKSIGQGTTLMRTHVEIDPTIGLTGYDAVRRLAADYAWGIEIEICVFPQEGIYNRPGTDELLVAALRSGAPVIGACPYTDTEPMRHLERVFELAHEHDVDIDMHLDFGDTADDMWIETVCDLAERYRWGGRTAVGHVSRLSALPAERFAAIGRRLADCGVAVTVLPSTDLYLMGRGREHSAPRGMAEAHRLLGHGVNCSISTNNVLNPFTPFGDCSLVRMANLYANIAQVGRAADLRACFDMVTARPARLLRRDDYGIAPGRPADLVLLDAATPEQAVAELAVPLAGYKRGRRTFTREPVHLHRP